MRHFSSLVSFVLPLVAALPWDGPQPTQEVGNTGTGIHTGWTPKPTSIEPDIQFYLDHDLVALELRKRKLDFDKRQATISSGAALSSTTPQHSTCGFLQGSSDNAYTCNDAAATCARDTVHSVYGCCYTPSKCEMPTSCVPYASLTACDDQCAANSYINKCASTAAFCNYNLLIDGSGNSAYAWYCDSTPAIVTLSVTATDGDHGVVTYAQVVMSIPSQDLTTTTPTSTSSSTSSSSTSTNPGTTTVTPTPTPAPTSEKKSTPTGAIVGGVVGGIAAIAIVAFLIWFFGFRKGRNTPATTQQAAPVNQGYQQPPVAGGAAYYGQGAPPEKEVYNANSPAPAHQYQSGDNRPMSQELYSPPHSPTPPYNGGAAVPGGNQYPYPNVAEVDGTSVPMTHNAGPGTY